MQLYKQASLGQLVIESSSFLLTFSLCLPSMSLSKTFIVKDMSSSSMLRGGADWTNA
jgi:hypothetical protein